MGLNIPSHCWLQSLAPDIATISYGLESVPTVTLFVSPVVPGEAVDSASQFASDDHAKISARTVEAYLVSPCIDQELVLVREEGVPIHL